MSRSPSSGIALDEAQLSAAFTARVLTAVHMARHTDRAVMSKIPRGLFDHGLNDRLFAAELHLAEVVA